MRYTHILATALISSYLVGCSSPSITAVNLDPNSKEPKGIPYYLPKPYLIVTKNVRYIPTPTVGLTQTVPIPALFNPPNGVGSTPATTSGGSAKSAAPAPPAPAPAPPAVAPAPATTGEGANQQPVYGNQVTVPAAVAVVPPASISDGLIPQEFYTYQIVYLPDLTQKYGLRIKGGSGELRATENLVNGWMHTGPGPFYLGNSSTAATVVAAGQAVGTVGQDIGQVLVSALGLPTATGASLANLAGQAKPAALKTPAPASRPPSSRAK